MTWWAWALVGTAIFLLAALLAVGLAQAASRGDQLMERDEWDEL